MLLLLVQTVVNIQLRFSRKLIYREICLVSIIQYDIVLYSRDHKGVGMAHKIISSITQHQFFLYDDEVGKTKPKKLSDRPEMPSTSCMEFKKNYLTEFSTD